MSEIPRKAAGKEQEITDANVAVTSKGDVLTARPMLENLPFPVMGISAGHEIVWMNAAGLKAYGAAQGQCHAVSHGYDSPCNLHGEPWQNTCRTTRQVDLSASRSPNRERPGALQGRCDTHRRWWSG